MLMSYFKRIHPESERTAMIKDLSVPAISTSMTILAFLYSEYRRLEEEVKHLGEHRKWDEKTHQYYSYLKQIFHNRID
jgi:hypothetical protein